MNTQLTNPLFSRYRQGEIAQYLKRLFEIFPQSMATDLNVQSEWQSLNTTYLELFSKWQPEKGSEFTAEIAALDEQRDALLNAFKKTVDAWALTHHDPAAQAAAQTVSHNLASHGDAIYRMNYEQESATIDAFINDCMTIHAAQIATIGLGDWITALNDVNIAFGEKYVERLGDYFSVEPGIVGHLIGIALGQYDALSRSFEVRWGVAFLDGDPLASSYDYTGQMWNVLTDEFNLVIRRRSGDAPAEDLPPPGGGEPSGV